MAKTSGVGEIVPLDGPCMRCGVNEPDVFTLRSGRRLCVVCMGLPEEYERFVAYFGSPDAGGESK